MEKILCLKCEEEKEETCFTIDKNGEYCDDCCIENEDRQYEIYKEREAERQMEEQEKIKK